MHLFNLSPNLSKIILISMLLLKSKDLSVLKIRFDSKFPYLNGNNSFTYRLITNLL